MWSAIHFATWNNSPDLVRFLLKQHQIHVNVEKLGGHTALFLACSKGLCQIVRILADDPRVDVNKKDRQGWTPLMVCCQFNFIDCARVLIASGRIKDLDYNFLTADAPQKMKDFRLIDFGRNMLF